MLRNVTRWYCAIISLAVMTLSAAAEEGQVVQTDRPVMRAMPVNQTGTATARARIRASSLSAERVEVHRAGPDGQVSGVGPPGTTVYRNEIDPASDFYIPGTGQRMADPLELASGACNVVYYSLRVFGQGTAGAPTTFSVQTELWDRDPCFGTASILPGSQQVFTGLPNDGDTVSILEVTLPAPAAAPGTVWLAATFSNNDVGWIIAERAEIGFTDDLWSENDPDPRFGCTQLYFGGDPYAGFWATVNCNITGDPPGACCDGTTCSEAIESVCVGAGGTWLGAFSDCEPNPCLLGACCSGTDFTTCTDSSQANCPGDRSLFHAGLSCDQNPCQLAFKVFENNFATGFFSTPAISTETWADDLRLSAGAPCELAGYSLITVGDETILDYHADVALWTNNDRGTASDETDDTPLAPITGTQRLFGPLPGNLAARTLLAGPFEGIQLPEKVWLVVSTRSTGAGPLLSGFPNIGSSRDAFAISTSPNNPDSWALVNFGGFDPTDCPGGESCNPAGSFDIDVWCYGEPPRGACCNDAAATCVDGVLETQCDGRWVPVTTCDAEPSPFNPGCGLSACCTPFGCTNRLPSECEAVGKENGFPVAIARGELCLGVTCPRASCLDATGDCFSTGTTPGCEDPFCCEAVCTQDELCCTNEWDSPCVSRAGTPGNLCERTLANDHCQLATEISDVGNFSFDTTTATTDGAPHAACVDLGEEDHILHDVWYCWTSPCNDYVTVSTCSQTEVDTKIAVYDGCDTCAPTDSQLVACNDDACSGAFQSQVVFRATVGEKKLIRVGTFPGSSGGPGQFSITCGVPANAACPGTGDCCGGNGTAACDEPSCCDLVCACDPVCCEEGGWDAACAGTGSPRSGFGCGAAVLCNECRRPGDILWDGILNLDDWALIQELCFQGPGVVNANSDCNVADTDANGTGDLRDVQDFATGFDRP